MVDLDNLDRNNNNYSIKSALLDMVDNEYYFIESALLKTLDFVEALIDKNNNPVYIKLNEMKKAIEKGLLPQQFKDKLYLLFKEYVLEIKQTKSSSSYLPYYRNTELEQTVCNLDIDFNNTTFEQLTDVQYDCYMMVYKNKINNASVVLDYLLFEHITMPELHEWTQLFNYHYG